MSLRDKLLALSEKLPSGCWRYTGGLSSQGYGRIWDEDSQQYYRAHRASYLVHKGEMGDLWVLHTCDNPWCINPDHLLLGTAKDNAEDMRSKGRDSYGENKGEANGQAVLKSKDIPEIRRLLDYGLSQSYIGSLFGVCHATISNIKSRKVWGHIP